MVTARTQDSQSDSKAQTLKLRLTNSDVHRTTQGWSESDGMEFAPENGEPISYKEKLLPLASS